MMNQWILQEQRFNRFSSGLCTKGTSAVQNCSASKGPSIISSLSFQFLSRQTDRRQKSEGLEKWWFEAYCWQRCPEIHQEVVHQLLSSTRPEYVSCTGITGKHNKLQTTVRMLKLGTRAKQQTSHYTASAVNDPCLNVLHVERFLTAESRNEVVILTSPYSPKLNWNAEQLPSNYPFSSTIHTNFRFFSVLSLVDHQIFRHKEIIPQKTEICCPGQSQLAWRLCHENCNRMVTSLVSSQGRWRGFHKLPVTITSNCHKAYYKYLSATDPSQFAFCLDDFLWDLSSVLLTIKVQFFNIAPLLHLLETQSHSRVMMPGENSLSSSFVITQNDDKTKTSIESLNSWLSFRMHSTHHTFSKSSFACCAPGKRLEASLGKQGLIGWRWNKHEEACRKW